MFSILFISLVIIFLNIDNSHQQACQYTPGVEYYGLNLPNTPILARSISECCNYCLANPKCQSWYKLIFTFNMIFWY